jgi:hypothetical protein
VYWRGCPPYVFGLTCQILLKSSVTNRHSGHCPVISLESCDPSITTFDRLRSSSNRSLASDTSASGSKGPRQVTPSVTPSIRRRKKSCHEESIHQPTPRRSQRILKRKRSQAESIIEPSRKSLRRAGNGIVASPPPSSSIRTSWRFTSISGLQGRQEYNGSAYKNPRGKEDTRLNYNLEDAVTRLFPSSPNTGHDKVFNDDGGHDTATAICIAKPVPPTHPENRMPDSSSVDLTIGFTLLALAGKSMVILPADSLNKKCIQTAKYRWALQCRK